MSSMTRIESADDIRGDGKTWQIFLAHYDATIWDQARLAKFQEGLRLVEEAIQGQVTGQHAPRPRPQKAAGQKPGRRVPTSPKNRSPVISLPRVTVDLPPSPPSDERR